MKILAVGDLHGKEKMIDRAEAEFIKNHYDKLIFMGDYIDSDQGYSFTEQIACIDKVNRLSLAYPDQVVTLLGNHDAAYLFNHSDISGFQASAATSFRIALEDGYFPITWQYKNWIFSHAGINKGWYKRHIHDIGWAADKSEARNLGDSINALFHTNRHNVLYEVGRLRGGRFDTGGPLWADKQEIWTKALEGYNQVIGHTRVAKKVVHELRDTKIYFIDCLKEDESDEFNFLGIDLDERATDIQQNTQDIFAEDRPRS